MGDVLTPQLADHERRMIRDTVSRYLAETFPPVGRHRELTRGVEQRRAQWEGFSRLGLLDLGLSKESGGLDASAEAIAVVMEELGRGRANLPFVTSILVCGSLLERWGDSAQRAEHLHSLRSGRSWFALAYTEREARYEASRITTQATRRGVNYVLDGRKTLVVDGADADHFIVIARNSGEAGEKLGISAFIVPTHIDGLTKQRYTLADGSHAAELIFDTVSVPASALLGEEGRMLAPLEESLGRANLALCSESIGIAGAAMETTLSHLRTRIQFGKELGTFQAIQHRMARVFLGLEQSRAIVNRALRTSPLAGNTEWLRCVSAAKVLSSRNSRLAAEEAVQFHGAMGITQEVIVGDYLKRLLVIAGIFGDRRMHVARYQDWSVEARQAWA